MSHTNVIAIPSLSSFIITPLTTNAALRGEQRYTTQFKPLCHKHKS
ncbi:TPA: hypothetical protein I7303_23215 [Vibrio parahaemolyticus]|nr:hypothetical protein [Vibrio parahaemolyticus]